MSEIYEPREDSMLIINEVRKLAHGNVLDMGTGSGILALAAAQKAEFVIGVDINKEALAFAKQQAEKYEIRNVKFYHSNIFSYFEEHPWKFDLIIFNPPYLPEDLREPEESRLLTTGGKHGYEVLEGFFSQASRYLMPYGKILIVFSSITGKDKIHEIIEKYGFDYQKLAEEDIFAETLFVYMADKSDLLRKVEMNGLTGLMKIAKGHRGFIYTANLGNTKVVVKKQREDKPVVGRIENEARWLKVLNRKKIGPEFIYLENNYFVYRYVEGEFIMPYLKSANKTSIKNLITDVFNQCFVLDKLGINKEEMHKPLKHILIKEGKPVLIDFERAHVTESPKNVTQFCQFISSKRVLDILKEKGFKIDKRQLFSRARQYKNGMNEDNLKEILRIIS